MSEPITHESLYRGRGFVTRRGKTKILVAGAGALGSRLVDSLCCQGYVPDVLDYDRVDRENLWTQNFGPPDIGKLKATQVAFNTFRRLGIKIQNVDKRLTAENADQIVKKYELVVDVFDNAASRQLLVDACRQANVQCLHSGMSGDGFAEIEWNENYHTHPDVAPTGNAPCEYPLALNLVLFSVAITSEVINSFVDDGIKRSIQFTLKDMHVDRVSTVNNKK